MSHVITLFVVFTFAVKQLTCDCGNLSSDTQELTVGETLLLKFVPNTNRTPEHLFLEPLSGPSRSIVIFERQKEKEPQKAKESKRGPEYAYTIESITQELSGNYMMRCKENNKYSNRLMINIAQNEQAKNNVTPPEVPQLTDLDDFLHCHRCIKALPKKNLAVTCKSAGGSPPIKIEIGISKDSKELDSAQYSSSKVSHTFNATEELEWATIFCKVSNTATTVPLSTNASVYLYRKPSDPKFDYSDIKEGEESEITCSTSGGRPQPRIYFKYNDKSENFTHTTKFDNNSRTFNVSSVYKRIFLRRDNQSSLTCCVVHDLFIGEQLYSMIQAMGDGQSDLANLITTAAISGSIVIVLTVVVVSIIIGRRKLKMRNSKKCKTNDQHSTETDNRLHAQETEHVNNEASIEPVEYSSVIPKHLRRNAQGNSSNEESTINEPSTGLVYTELDFDPSSRTTVSKRTEPEPIEYVTINSVES